MTEFSRREVNGSLLAAAFALVGGGGATARTRLYDFALAGGPYHGLDAVRDLLRPGERLALRAEPDNPYDANAVAVLRGALRLGYVPRAANLPVAQHLAAGREASAEVIGPLQVRRGRDIPEGLVFTGFTTGDPLLRLWVG